MSQRKEHSNAREWLLANNYGDIAALIDKVMEGLETEGNSNKAKLVGSSGWEFRWKGQND